MGRARSLCFAGPVAPGTRTAGWLAAVAAATIVAGFAIDAAGGGLGTPLPPFFAHWDPAIDGAGVAWVALLGATLAGAIALLRPGRSVLTFLAGAFALALVARLALAAAREGIDGWYTVFGTDPEAANEYLPVLPTIESLGVRDFLDRFAELAPTLPIHPSAHPPGTPLLIDAMGIVGPRALAAFVIVVGAAAVPLTYALGRCTGLGEERARAAAMLIALSPAAMLYGVVSTDAMFATFGLAAACLLLAGGIGARVLGMLALAVASFFSWALLAIGAFATIVVALRESVRAAAGLAIGAGLAVLGFYAALHAATGFDPIGAIEAAGEAYDLGISSARPYLFWLFGSPVAFAVALGLPTAWYAARALGTGDAVAIGLAAIIVVAAVIGLTKAETERIWLFMGPLAAVAAAALVPRERMPLLLALLAAQALAASLLLETIW